MTKIWTVECQGTAVAAFSTKGEIDAADAWQDAQAFIDESSFMEDLSVLESGGKPLWDGSSIINLRPASDGEREAFKRSFQSTVEAGAEERSEDGYVAFLVPVSDPTDDE